MRNKGFYWFISVSLIVVCLFQLSYTWVASSVEGAAELKANQKVKALRLTADKNGIAYINNDTIDFNSDGAELAKAAYITGAICPALNTKRSRPCQLGFVLS